MWYVDQSGRRRDLITTVVSSTVLTQCFENVTFHSRGPLRTWLVIHTFNAEVFPRRYCWGRGRLYSGKRETTLGRGKLFLPLQCHHQIDFCIKIGSDDNYFNVSLIVGSKVTKTVSTDNNYWRERRVKAANRTVEIFLLTSLTPYRWAKPAHFPIRKSKGWHFIELECKSWY